jgi:hypothetical protein
MMIRRVSVLTAIIILLSLFVVFPVLAHNRIPRVEISIDRLHPGEVVDVRGVSFGMDDSVTLTLIGSGVDVSFGEIIASGEGEFTYIAVIPPDLGEGTYYFRAVTSHHFVLSPPLTVWGTVFTEGGGQGPRDDEDGLLAPMPTYPPGFIPGGVPQATVPPAVQEPPTSNLNLAGSLLIAGVVGILLAFGMRWARKR